MKNNAGHTHGAGRQTIVAGMARSYITDGVPALALP